ncbi:MAG TPA: VUT family protein [Chloroflexota bacterium]|nr:VUT family protein [Chloroflexota bacterium]
MTLGLVYGLAYIATIFAANLAILLIGPVPVGFGLMAPAGVYFAGLAFTLRDLTQDTLGKVAVLVAILIGAALSAAMSLVLPGPIPPVRLALASGSAFLFSELLDFAVYTPLRRRHWLGAVAASNAVGLVADSALFLSLAFGSLAFLPGQIVGKTTMTLLAIPALALLRRNLQNSENAPTRL